MSKQVREFWDRLKDIPKEMGSEIHRLNVQASMELASSLFNGHAFVPYGPGQWKGAEREGAQPQEKEPEREGAAQAEKQQERGGMEM
jgi:hypothetical protein